MKRLLSIFRHRLTTAAFLALAAVAFVASQALSFGGPSPAKVVVRVVFVSLFLFHLLTVYGGPIKKLLFYTDGPLRPARPGQRAGTRFYALAGFIMTAAFFTRTFRLTQFLTADESKWLVNRIPRFFSDLLAFNWHNLLISDKPGITFSWIVEAGLVFTDKEGSGVLLGDPGLLFWSRLPLVVANILLLVWLTYLVRRATKSEAAALIVLALTATNPTIMGMSAIVNPDSLSWFFPLAAVLIFVVYLRERYPWDLAQGALLFALGVLNKFNFLSVLPFLPLVAVVYFVFDDRDDPGFFKLAAGVMVRLYLLSWFVAIFIWPYLLLAPQQYILHTIGRPIIRPFLVPIGLGLILFAFFGDSLARRLTPLKAVARRLALAGPALVSLALIALTIKMTPGLPSIAKTTMVEADLPSLLMNNYFYHFYSQTTVTIILYVLALIVLLAAGARREAGGDGRLLSAVALLFILGYLVGSAATDHITSARYQIPVFPAVGLFIADSFRHLAAGVKVRQASLAAGAVALANLALVWPFAPYYLLHHNHFLPAGKVLFEGWGLGGYEAAAYLNKKPNAGKMTVYASYSGFSYFFRGKALDREENPYDSPVDYLVLFKQGEMKSVIAGDPAKDRYWRRQAKAEFEMLVNGVPLVKVVKFKP